MADKDDSLMGKIRKYSPNQAAQVEESEAVTRKYGDEVAKDKLDIDAMEAADINRVAEKLAKDNGVDFNEALDWCYDGKVSKEGKLL